MERIANIDERIRRAEELYNRRKMQGGIRVSTSNVNNNRTNLGLFKRLFIKIIICTIIYLIFLFLKNSGMFFSENIINQTQKIMAYDINLKQVYSQAVEMFNKIAVKNKPRENYNIEETDIEDVKELEMQNDNEADIKEQEQLGRGGPAEQDEDLSLIEQNLANTTIIQKTQMEIDADYIKSKFTFIKPVQGIVTSRFGTREATEIISADHKGIDIGASTGTPIYSAIEGTVTEVSNYGDYGKHLQITNGDVVTLYAHCNEINVSNGDYVAQGQQIAKVGETGRATGPHLHFEIKREGRAIDPEYILSF